jgi:shikimate dehydrogenase
MKYGLIGEHLGHSFSREIHMRFRDYEYELCEVRPSEFDAFMMKRDFLAINVTIPYKELVVPYLYYIDDKAKEIGAVNTVVNNGGKLYGYNTDFLGMRALFSHAGISLENKKVAVLGTGGTSKTAVAVARDGGALGTVKVSRRMSEDAITYAELYKDFSDVEIIINTTPSGMFPNNYDCPIDISRLPKLEGVIDAVYNPVRTLLVSEAMRHGIAAEGGLYMLVEQAVRASEYFLGDKAPDGIVDEIYRELKEKKENIILIGMPSSGKSTVGAIIAEQLSRELIDTDAEIVRSVGVTIPEIFENWGEEHFRNLESEVIFEVAKKSGTVIATGGGAVLRPENIYALKENGRVYFIDRPLDALIPTEDRPLSSTREAIEKRYNERYKIYCSSADVIINGEGSPCEVAERILGEFCK